MPLPPPLLKGLLAPVAVALLAACSSEPAREATTGAAATSPSPSPSPSCRPAPLRERAAVVLHVGLPGVTEADDPLVADVLPLGVGGVFLERENVEDAQQLTALAEGLRAAAPGPLSVSTDEESGRVAVTREVVGAGPSPRRLAASRTPEQVRAFAADLGERLADVGIDLDLAPLLDLDDGPSGGIIGDRSFSADPEEAAEYGLAFSRGLMDAGVRPTVKHFPGHGRSTVDTHAKAAVVQAPLSELEQTDLLPFQRAVDAGVPVVMLNHLGYRALDPDLPASLSPEAYALLRDMGFDGVAMTDSLGMGAVNLRWDFPEAAVRAIEAGADVALVKDGQRVPEVVAAIVDAVESGRLPEERLNEAAARSTALAGGDPVEVSCVEYELPELTDAAPAAPTSTASPSARATSTASPSARATTTASPSARATSTASPSARATS